MRFSQLDSLRAFAVALVMWHHWAPRYQFGIDWGRCGVTMFFVLSGFLITGILLDGREAGIRPGRMIKRFYLRRSVRIFPLFYFVCLLAFVLDAPGTREAIWWHVSYLSNFYFFGLGRWSGPTSHFWSLAVEEQFYCLWPLLMLFLPRKCLLPSMVACIVVATLFRFAMATVPLSFYLTPATLDALASGAVIAFVMRAYPSALRNRRVVWTLAVIGLLVVGLRVPALFQTGCILISGALIISAAHGIRGPIGGLLNLRALQYVGLISYGLYVYHTFAGFIAYDLLRIPKQAFVPQLFLFAAITLGLATISWHCFEKPVNKLKDFFPYAPDETASFSGPIAAVVRIFKRVPSVSGNRNR